jgi:DNA-binding transcriptional ArsR family regulator
MARKLWRQAYPFAFCVLPLSYIETWMPHLSPNAHKVYTVIARATWGWSKESDVLAIDEIARRSGLPRRSVDRSLAELRRHGLLICEGPHRHVKAMRLVLSRLMQIPGSATVASPDGKVVSILASP